MTAIKLYSSPFCSGCKLTKKMLERQCTKFHEIDVTVDKEAAKFLKDRGLENLPVIARGDEVLWWGFRPDKVRGLTGARGGIDLNMSPAEDTG